MTKHQLARNIFLVRFESQFALASTFLRFQEHYESRRFRNRVFSLEQFMDWYARTFGAFTYYEDWSGFNVPSAALTAFYQGRFDPLWRKEERLLKMFARQRGPFYVIGLTAGEDITHELAHALYHMRPEYRKAVRTAMRGHDTSALKRQLVAMGYHPAVAADEAHAYLVASDGVRGASLRRLAALRRALRAIYRRHAAEFTPA